MIFCFAPLLDKWRPKLSFGHCIQPSTCSNLASHPKPPWNCLGSFDHSLIFLVCHPNGHIYISPRHCLSLQARRSVLSAALAGLALLGGPETQGSWLRLKITFLFSVVLKLHPSNVRSFVCFFISPMKGNITAAQVAPLWVLLGHAWQGKRGERCSMRPLWGILGMRNVRFEDMTLLNFLRYLRLVWVWPSLNICVSQLSGKGTRVVDFLQKPGSREQCWGLLSDWRAS